MTAHIRQGDRQGKFHTQRLHRKRKTMQHFGITRKHVSHIDFLYTKLSQIRGNAELKGITLSLLEPSILASGVYEVTT